MQAHNYCRQLRGYFGEWWRKVKSEKIRLRIAGAIDGAEKSQKFQLPDGGRILGDMHYRAIDDGDRLSLPFERVALEYKPIRVAGGLDDLYPTDGPTVTRTVVFLAQDETHIYGRPCWTFRESPERWHVCGEFAIQRDQAIVDRNEKDGARIAAQMESDINPRDVMDEIGATVDFLNALQCSNVGTERMDPKHGAKVKGALPFDSYHVLTIRPSATVARDTLGGSHRSPREHLRRGHIRRLETGAKVWVNATVVNPGVGGKVRKDYRVAA